MLNYPKLVDNLSTKAIFSAAKKYIDPKNVVKVVLFPEKKQ
jgi:predicted Zn-dependent peptidase